MKILFPIICLILFGTLSSCKNIHTTERQPTTRAAHPYDDKSLIIYYDPKVGKDQLLKAVTDFGATVIYDYKNISAIAIKLPVEKDLAASEQYFHKISGVTMVQKNYRSQTTVDSVN